MKSTVNILGRVWIQVMFWQWIRWTRPFARWMELNTDGGSKDNPSVAWEEGLLRNRDGIYESSSYGNGQTRHG